MSMYLYFNTSDLPQDAVLQIQSHNHAFGGGPNQDEPWTEYMLQIIIHRVAYHVDFVGNGAEIPLKDLNELSCQTTNRATTKALANLFLELGVPFSYA